MTKRNRTGHLPCEFEHQNPVKLPKNILGKDDAPQKEGGDDEDQENDDEDEPMKPEEEDESEKAMATTRMYSYQADYCITMFVENSMDTKKVIIEMQLEELGFVRNQDFFIIEEQAKGCCTGLKD